MKEEEKKGNTNVNLVSIVRGHLAQALSVNFINVIVCCWADSNLSVFFHSFLNILLHSLLHSNLWQWKWKRKNYSSHSKLSNCFIAFEAVRSAYQNPFERPIKMLTIFSVARTFSVLCTRVHYYFFHLLIEKKLITETFILCSSGEIKRKKKSGSRNSFSVFSFAFWLNQFRFFFFVSPWITRNER